MTTPTLELLYIEAELRKLAAQVPTMDSETVDRLDDELSGLMDELEQAIVDRQNELMRLAKRASPVIVEVVVVARNKAHDLILSHSSDEGGEA